MCYGECKNHLAKMTKGRDTFPYLETQTQEIRYIILLFLREFDSKANLWTFFVKSMSFKKTARKNEKFTPTEKNFVKSTVS